MAKKSPITVYWAPRSLHEEKDFGEWNMLYEDPTNLYLDIVDRKTKESKNKSYLSCPAVTDRFKNTYVFRNNTKTEYTYDWSDIENPKLFNTLDTGVFISSPRPSTINDGPTLLYSQYYYLFSDEPLKAFFNPPMFHEPKHTKNGTVIPGAFDIGQWYRPFGCEMQMWSKTGSFVIEENEPLFYLEFDTDREVILKRYKLTPELVAYSASCVASPNSFGSNLPLIKRYERFTKTRTNTLVLNEIKKNLID